MKGCYPKTLSDKQLLKKLEKVLLRAIAKTERERNESSS